MNNVVPRSVLIIGATGGVGEGIVDALLENGSFERVVASSRSSQKLRALRERAGQNQRLITIEGSVADAETARALLHATLAYGTLAAVVVSIGGWLEHPPLTAVGDDAWKDALAALLTPHFVAARTFVPALEGEHTKYLMIGGGAATRPVPGATLVSIAGAAQLMLARSLVAERPETIFPIIEELVVAGPVTTNARHHGPLTANEITAREVGDVVVEVLHNGTTGEWPHVTRDGPIVTMFPKRHGERSAAFGGIRAGSGG